MEKLLIRSARPEVRYRAGRAWTAEGVVVAPDDLDEAGWEAVRADPLLRIEVAPAEAEGDEAETGAAARAEIVAAIAELPPEAFGADGKPKLDALRAARPGLKISAALRDEVWADAKGAPAS